MSLTTTPPEDEMRFISASLLKLDALEQSIATLMNEAENYTGIEKRHVTLAKVQLECGLLYLQEALETARHKLTPPLFDSAGNLTEYGRKHAQINKTMISDAVILDSRRDIDDCR